MRVLLDECVPWPMHKLLAGHDCTSTQWRGWKGIKNGDLIRLAEQEFDLFITSDQNLRYQQNLAGRRLAILELSTTDLRRILTASGDIVAAVATIGSGDFRHLEIP
ncbi:MAG: hypothetical protein EHM17_01960 [Verrucomicrobiaceae bacterium]|nr:MAG: hypothetical protein EHM17_01960 [Verrucomicrobiaceae bacterium]